MGEVSTDKAVLIFDGEGDLKEGMSVFVKDENDEIVPAENGEYRTEDGKVIVVEDGIVVSISDPEAEVAPEEEVTETEETVEMEENLDVEPADDTVPDGTETPLDERVANLEGRVAEFVDGLNQIINAIATLETRMEEVEGKLLKVEAPAANPIDDTPEVEESAHRTKLSYLRKD